MKIDEETRSQLYSRQWAMASAQRHEKKELIVLFSECKQVVVEAILPLRTRVLRPHFEAGQLAQFPGDLDATTRHYAAYDGGAVIGCATLMWVELPQPVLQAFGAAPSQGWQLRGMAVDPAHQGAGVGGALLSFVEEELLGSWTRGEPLLLWCNARERAMGLYRRFGMQALGERFIMEGIGPHFMMARQLA